MQLKSGLGCQQKSPWPCFSFQQTERITGKTQWTLLVAGKGGMPLLGTVPSRIVAADVGHCSLCALVLLTLLV